MPRNSPGARRSHRLIDRRGERHAVRLALARYARALNEDPAMPPDCYLITWSPSGRLHAFAPGTPSSDGRLHHYYLTPAGDWDPDHCRARQFPSLEAAEAYRASLAFPQRHQSIGYRESRRA